MHRLVVALLLAGAASVSPASGKECGPLKMVASLDLVERRPNQYMVPVIVNGTPMEFLVDTGGIYTQISPRAAAALNLKFESGATRIYDVSGNTSSGYVKLDGLTMGGVTGKDVYVRVLPTNMLADGILAPDLMKRFDVEIDFSGKKLNYFLSDHCHGKVVYWPHDNAARVSLVLADQRWIRVPVTLDGKSFMAIIDTGATGTIITTDTARDSFGLDTSSPGMEPAGNINGDPNLASYRRTFSTLTLDGITIKNPRILIMPDRMSDSATHAPRNARLAVPEVTLGMNVLRHLHLYFAFQEHNLYVTPGSAPAPAAGAEPVPAAAAAETPR